MLAPVVARPPRNRSRRRRTATRCCAARSRRRRRAVRRTSTRRDRRPTRPSSGGARRRAEADAHANDDRRDAAELRRARALRIELPVGLLGGSMYQHILDLSRHRGWPDDEVVPDRCAGLPQAHAQTCACAGRPQSGAGRRYGAVGQGVQGGRATSGQDWQRAMASLRRRLRRSPANFSTPFQR